jgi:hypothetical protein
MLLFSVYVSSSCIMAWWWSEFVVETSCHTNKSIYKWVGCDYELIIQIFADHFIIENIFYHFPINNSSDWSHIPCKACISLKFQFMFHLYPILHYRVPSSSCSGGLAQSWNVFFWHTRELVLKYWQFYLNSFLVSCKECFLFFC